jgi:hypothetical protein
VQTITIAATVYVARVIPGRSYHFVIAVWRANVGITAKYALTKLLLSDQHRSVPNHFRQGGLKKAQNFAGQRPSWARSKRWQAQISAQQL